MKDPIRSNDRESADAVEYVDEGQTYITPLKHNVGGHAFGESELELGHSGDGANVYATFAPHGGSGPFGEGIVVSRNFEVTEVKNTD